MNLQGNGKIDFKVFVMDVKPVFEKIPVEVKKKGCIASGRYCVFASLMQAGQIFTALEKAETNSSVPVVGYLKLKNVKYYYCLYGAVDDPDIYQ